MLLGGSIAGSRAAACSGEPHGPLLACLSARRPAPCARQQQQQQQPSQAQAPRTAALPSSLEVLRPGASRQPAAAGNAQRSAPRAAVVASALATDAPQQATGVENVVIIGSGPAGYTAAIYSARANLKPVVLEGLRNGRGGQLMGTTEVENFPGFPEGVTGPDLMDRMRKQAERWGAELYTEDVESVDLSTRPFTIRSADRELRAHSIVIATGATAKRLGLPSEQAFWGKGISACAICDGASPLFKNQQVAVAGGGDSATEEAVYLTKYASHVHLIVRGERLRASKAMQDRVLSNKNVTVHFNTGIEDAYGGETLSGLMLTDRTTGAKHRLDVKGLFYGIGHTPNSGLVAGQIELDEAGYVKVSHGVSTSVPGVFSAGDLHDTEWRQAITAAGSGCMAALSVERYLTSNGLAQEFKQSDDAYAGHHSEGASSNGNGNGRSAGSSNGNGASSSGSGTTSVDVDTADSFDIKQDKHKGQFALRKLYHDSDRLIAVLYTAPTCGPCRTLKPIFNGVVDEYKGQVHYVEIDIEADPEIAEAAGVMGTPTVQFFRDKQQLATLPGVKMKKDYRQIISENVKQQVMA